MSQDIKVGKNKYSPFAQHLKAKSIVKSEVLHTASLTSLKVFVTFSFEKPER